MNKVEWFKQEKKSFLKGVPKKDGSGGGMRLNKGRGLCPPEKQEKVGKGKEFSPERALKLTGGMVLTAGAVLAGTKLIGAIGDIDL